MCLGILLYELFHRRAPFPGRVMNEVMNKIKKNHIKFKKNLDVRIRNLINKILQIDPQKRPTCQEILESPELIELTREFDISNQLFDLHQSNKPKSKR
jgi:calcium-dependent protein kinase